MQTILHTLTLRIFLLGICIFPSFLTGQDGNRFSGEDTSLLIHYRTAKQRFLNGTAPEVLFRSIDSLAEIYPPDQHPSLFSRLLNIKGSALAMVAQDYEAAEPILKKALKLARKAQDSNMMVMLNVNLLGMYVTSEQPDKGQQYAEIAMDLVERLDYAPGKAQIHFIRGELFEQQEHYTRARNAYLESVEIYKELGKTTVLAIALSHLADAYSNIGEVDSAILKLEEAVALSEIGAPVATKPAMLNNLGNLYLLKEAYNKAIKAYQQAAEAYLDVGDSTHLGSIYHNIGNIHLHQGKWERAIAPMQKVLESSYLLADPYLDKSKLHKDLSSGYAELGDSSRALIHAHTFIRMAEEAKIIEGENRIAILTKLLDDERERSNQLLFQRQKTYLISGLVITLLALAVAMLVAYVYRKNQKLAKIQAEETAKQSRREIIQLLQRQEVESLNARLEGQDKERARIAADLHDGLGGTLAAVQVSLSLIQGQMLGADAKVVKHYQQASRLLNDACEDVRRISHNMADNLLKEAGFSGAVRQLTETLKTTHPFELEVDISSLQNYTFDSQVELNLYRVLQELFQNIVKHANATRVSLQITRIQNRINVILEDDGVGFDPKARKGKGLGLTSLETRINKVNGSIEFNSEKGNGTTVVINIPKVSHDT